MSSPAGWYPDPGGQPKTFRYWDGKVWSAATTQNPNTPPPTQSLVGTGAGQTPPPGPAFGHQGYQGYQQGYGQGQVPQGYGQTYGSQGLGGQGAAYAGYQQPTKPRSAKGWWIGAIAVVVVLVVVVVIAVRALASGNGPLSGTNPAGPGSENPCPTVNATASPEPHPNDGRVHGGPISYPELGFPWGAPTGQDSRLPFGSDVHKQEVLVQGNYNSAGDSWVASVLVGRLQAGDGFFTPHQGSQIVVKCILGAFYGNAEVNSDVTIDQKATIDGHDAWVVESQLSFDIQGLQTKGELLIVAIVAADQTSSGIYYASIPDTTPELVAPARNALRQLRVDG
ncbi:MAG: DUF2510 domain-containing protein [Propionibacteriaceae bacterium]